MNVFTFRATVIVYDGQNQLRDSVQRLAFHLFWFAYRINTMQHAVQQRPVRYAFRREELHSGSHLQLEEVKKLTEYFIGHSEN